MTKTSTLRHSTNTQNGTKSIIKIISLISLLLLAIFLVANRSTNTPKEMEFTTEQLAQMESPVKGEITKSDSDLALKASISGQIHFFISFEDTDDDGCRYGGDAQFLKIFIPFPPLYTDEECNASEAYDYANDMLEYAREKIAELTHSTKAVDVITKSGTWIILTLQTMF